MKKLLILSLICLTLTGCSNEQSSLIDQDTKIEEGTDTLKNDVESELTKLDEEIKKETEETKEVEDWTKEKYSQDVLNKIEEYERTFGEGKINYNGEGSFYFNNYLILIYNDNIKADQLREYLDNEEYRIPDCDDLGFGEIYFESKTDSEVKELMELIKSSGLVKSCSINSIIEIGLDGETYMED